ncbi:B3/4 domain-containing protein [Acidaminobacter sp. JC074]|uniref:B3/B4 domain-containing protein n=1 Tax=Acidaminobacter sp. JC074 TaxID=2530199 RepID=UPI001F0F65D0|nr:phenylalanine--tRNA ligase beta subunit-related protein [Acidaminobacter sp. JC074]
MKYSVANYVFDQVPSIRFGIIVGSDIKNSPTSQEDSDLLKEAEVNLRSLVAVENLKTHGNYLNYRQALKAFDINPNKYMNSIEAMSKRVLKGGSLPRINALVDRLNAIALKYQISLGGHDLKDIHADLSVRRSSSDDIFLPFGQTEFEAMPQGEMIFTSGNEVQTRYWLWRQSELGKMTLDTNQVFFQMVGFDANLEKAIEETENLIRERFGGNYKTFIVDKEIRSIEF